MNKSKTAFSEATDIIGQGVDALFNNDGPQYSMIYLDMIEVKAQIREEFSDDENSLEGLAANIAEHGVLQPILIRPNETGGYDLVAGERRYRAAKIAGLSQIPAIIKEMTDEQADDAQMAENIHRKNLTQLEEARKIRRDLEKLEAQFGKGKAIEPLLEKYNGKSRSWLSKRLELLNLPDQTIRLIREDISADLEVIHAVKQVEKIDPVAAQQLVDDLKDTRFKDNARDKVKEVKDSVKPSKKKPSTAEQIEVFAAAKNQNEDDIAMQGLNVDPQEILNRVYEFITGKGKSNTTKNAVASLSPVEKEAVENWLQLFYDSGSSASNIGNLVIQGLHNGPFSSYGSGAFALAAFLNGVDSKARFSLLNIFGNIKG
uniref:ParB/RepB/Spo0J family partition protein n=1 Tax=Methylomonas sp. SPW-1 TaxID=3438877 RepID=UPI00402BAAE8